MGGDKLCVKYDAPQNIICHKVKSKCKNIWLEVDLFEVFHHILLVLFDFIYLYALPCGMNITDCWKLFHCRVGTDNPCKDIGVQ